ncbi:MAG: ABC transporter permease [Ilumatobacteraceae bacterium]
MIAPRQRASRLTGLFAPLRRTGLLGIVCAAVITISAILAVVGPWIAPHDPESANGADSWIGSVPGHLLGFDAVGRDLLSRLLAGARTSMLGPLIVVLASVIFGTALATVSAWRGGRVDTAISSVIDIVFAFPGILLAILATTALGVGLTAAVVALAIAYTPFLARVLRSAALVERGLPYVAALEVQGASSFTICVRHIIPNLAPIVVAQATTIFGYAMVDLAAISFLGLGVQPPAPDWGVMVNENQSGVLQGYYQPSLAAGLCIVLVVVAFNILGERLYEQAQVRNR